MDVYFFCKITNFIRLCVEDKHLFFIRIFHICEFAVFAGDPERDLSAGKSAVRKGPFCDRISQVQKFSSAPFFCVAQG